MRLVRPEPQRDKHLGGTGVAVREFAITTGEADYLRYVARKSIAVVEPKPKDHSLIGVESLSAKYVGTLPPAAPCIISDSESP